MHGGPEREQLMKCGRCAELEAALRAIAQFEPERIPQSYGHKLGGIVGGKQAGDAFDAVRAIAAAKLGTPS
jgi:hypothetical protein